MMYPLVEWCPSDLYGDMFDLVYSLASLDALCTRMGW